jgi:hypothetical protein
MPLHPEPIIQENIELQPKTDYFPEIIWNFLVSFGSLRSRFSDLPRHQTENSTKYYISLISVYTD